MTASLRSLALLLILPALCLNLRAADEGQADLDAAIDKKLDAEKFEELGEVIRLGESALKKGLDEANTKFAKGMLAGTYGQRGIALGEVAFRSMSQAPTSPTGCKCGPARWPIWRRPSSTIRPRPTRT
ncbi:MAG: hypothetical protein QM811_17635 [Pirellulales bacterium]